MGGETFGVEETRNDYFENNLCKKLRGVYDAKKKVEKMKFSNLKRVAVCSNRRISGGVVGFVLYLRRSCVSKEKEAAFSDSLFLISICHLVYTGIMKPRSIVGKFPAFGNAIGMSASGRPNHFDNVAAYCSTDVDGMNRPRVSASSGPVVTRVGK